MSACRGTVRGALVVVLLCGAAVGSFAAEPTLKLHTRSRVAVEGAPERFDVREEVVEWIPRTTAIVICDMWDQHWCAGATRRVAELAGPMNRVLDAARQRGVLIVHAPSDTLTFYAEAPERLRASDAPFVPPPEPFASSKTWGRGWFGVDRQREAALPIDDSDGGCDCATPCKRGAPWRRQIARLEIHPSDVICDNVREMYNVFAQRKIENVIFVGVHLNMCVLSRNFGIRQQVRLGKHVVVMRDMVDVMYNPRRPPQVSHHRGTELMVEHVEKYWCPSITSVDFVGGAPFRFADDREE